MYIKATPDKRELYKKLKADHMHKPESNLENKTLKIHLKFKQIT